jgi:uncharacterized protein (TIGR03086 family)
MTMHRRALDLLTRSVVPVGPERWSLPTPCAGWDLRDLIAHLVGQNHGFAEAVAEGDAPERAFTPRGPAAEPGEWAAQWHASVDRLVTAFGGADPDRPVRLVEIAPDRRLPVRAALGFQLLDTTVHAWDVATALGEAFRPDDDLVAVTVELARQVPSGEARDHAGAAFAPEVATADGDDWVRALALLGRSAAPYRTGRPPGSDRRAS